MKAIKLNPTWYWAGTVLCEAIRHGDDEAACEARQELLRALSILDDMLEEHTDYFDEKEV